MTATPIPKPVRTHDELAVLIRKQIGNRLFVSVSNREPFVHSRSPDGTVQVRAAVGGLTLALNSVMQAVGGIWVAHGDGNADRETADARGRVAVPPDAPSYELQRVWLEQVEHERYYSGFANQALWPLCHVAFTKPVFRQDHWEAYRGVNTKFAEAVAGVVGDREAIVFVQDYHFALLPTLIRQRCPRATILHFWHIPWPLPDILRVCPWSPELLDGLLDNDVLGFHTPDYAERFLAAASARPGWRSAGQDILERKGSRICVRPFPISIDFDGISAKAAGTDCDAAVDRLRKRYGLAGKFIVLGLDRIDYTKGVIERLQAVERLLELHPEMRGRLVYLNAGAPSRNDIPAYQQLHRSMDELETRINATYGGSYGNPVVSIKEQLPESDVLALYRLADVCAVSSLEDGMNLVAKEYIAARNDNGGRLLLSEFTGAAWELPGAETFNPFAIDAFSERLLAMSEPDSGQSAERMRKLRQHVREHTIYGWIGSILETLQSSGRTSG